MKVREGSLTTISRNEGELILVLKYDPEKDRNVVVGSLEPDIDGLPRHITLPFIFNKKCP
jgi:hypothetical protein